MTPRPIDPTHPHPAECPPGTVGRPPWCFYPTVRKALWALVFGGLVGAAIFFL